MTAGLPPTVVVEEDGPLDEEALMPVNQYPEAVGMMTVVKTGTEVVLTAVLRAGQSVTVAAQLVIVISLVDQKVTVDGAAVDTGAEVALRLLVQEIVAGALADVSIAAGLLTDALTAAEVLATVLNAALLNEDVEVEAQY